MKCLECAQHDSAEQAVGVCESCGAAACARHARVVHLAGTPASTGHLGAAPRRQLRCGFCSADRPEALRADDPAEVDVRPCGHDRCLCGVGVAAPVSGR